MEKNLELDVYQTPQLTAEQQEQQLKDWYNNEFMPYKIYKEQERKNFQEFKSVIKENSREIKLLLAALFEGETEDAVEIWNYLKLKPAITKISLEGENLVITDIDEDIHEVHFDSLLDKIDLVLKG